MTVVSGTMSISIGIIGLDGLPASSLCGVLGSPEYKVHAYDADVSKLQELSERGGEVYNFPKDVAEKSRILVCTAADEKELNCLLFGSDFGVISGEFPTYAKHDPPVSFKARLLTTFTIALPKQAVLVILAPVQPSSYESLLLRIAKHGRQDLLALDMTIVASSTRSNISTSTLFVSGRSEAIEQTKQLLHKFSKNVYIIPGALGQASKAALVNQLLISLHTATACEAMGLAARAGLNPKVAYDIISNAAGTSSAFETRVPQMLSGNWTPQTSLESSLRGLKLVNSTARSLHFPLQLSSAVEQLFISGMSQGFSHDDVAGLVRVYLPGSHNLINETAERTKLEEALTPSSSPFEVSKIGMIGLGAMGQGMAASLVRAGFQVQGYDIYAPAVEKFLANGVNATAADSPSAAIEDADIVLLMVQNAAQVEDVLFASGCGADVLSDGAIVILSSTVPPEFVRKLNAKLKKLGRGITLVDAPVSGGVARAANGTLTIICSGESLALSKANAALLAMTGGAKNLCHVDGGIGAASSVKLINQLLAGVHIASAAEAMAFAARLDIDTSLMFEIVKSSGAWSWMFENRVPQMLDADWTPHSALAIFVKDLGIVLDEAARLEYYAPISSAAHTLYLSGASHGWSKEADAGVVRLWELLGPTIASKAGSNGSNGSNMDAKNVDQGPSRNEPQPLPAATTLASLPPEHSTDVLSNVRRVVDSGEVPTLVVLDDDPTGTQTCHDIDVLAVWDSDTLDSEFNLNPTGFFILTNSRALPSAEARQLIQEICENVSRAAKKANKAFEIVLRGDSTLRGHLPEEPEAAEAALGLFDGWVITPFFAQGGRYTIDDVHYVKEGDVLLPASQTPFAQDATFGYKNSNLRHYIQEKCGSRFNESSFTSVTLDDIRLGGPEAVTQKLLSVSADPNRVLIVNAVAESDMHVFVAGLLEAEKSGRRYLYRTGAAFVSSRLGIKSIPPLTMQDLGVVPCSERRQPGGLIIAGSYVPKTTAQLKILRERLEGKLVVIELQVPDLIGSDDAAERIVQAAAQDISKHICAGQDVLVMTSRALIKGDDGLSSLNIGSKVARALVHLVELIDARPRYIIAKGGITSSDAATKGLRIRRARILGQAAPGVPLWRCDEETSRHRGVPFVVFPGNVGSESTLAEVVEAWAITNTA
ncbi:hypothetical protein QQS21_002324 [Conoideocrella luteorostrata]|uniref:Ketose-bisphosphate aldolase class-II family protein n=1 Tax=Conoideocrella luteorostrata TaxID=1105319 RepID=A0AAJ0CVA3_9HYPO|nr:hypothetical protein QQS21_002324 [Conoideocrella luteorostrata]